jgi:hypothetical protein
MKKIVVKVLVALSALLSLILAGGASVGWY